MNTKGGFVLSIIVAAVIFIVGVYIGHVFFEGDSDVAEENSQLKTQIGELQSEISVLEARLKENYVPVEQPYTKDEHCDEGESVEYDFDGSQSNFIACHPFPEDLGKVCSSSEDCEYGCLTTDEDLVALGCEKIDCSSDKIFCENIKGRCSVYGTESELRVIFESGMVSNSCPD